MRSVLVDKIASVALAADLGQEIRVSPDIPVRGGRADRRRGAQQQVALQHARAHERPHGRGEDAATSSSARSATAKRCSATRAICRPQLKPGDVVQLLNLGGVIGVCDSINPSHGEPFDCRVLGVVLDFPYLGQRVGVPARVAIEPLNLERAARRSRACPSSRSPALA